jgi:diguanylate cyclase (GGDEF)-like protein
LVLTQNIGVFIYPMRVMGYFIAGCSVYLARQPAHHPNDLYVWTCLLIFIIYPHLARVYFSYHHHRHVEINNLLGDMFLIGIITNLLYFNPVLSLPFLIANSATNYAVGGLKHLIKGLAVLLLGVVVGLIIFGGQLQTDYSQAELIAPFTYLLLASHYIGYISYLRGLVLIHKKDKAEDMAFNDGLTGIANRRSYDLKLDEEWHRALRDKHYLSLIFLDIDHFKGYNDRYGHPAGDDCLQKVAHAIAEQASRPGDLVARTGGEEFSVILPSASLDNAMVVAEKILHAVRDLNIEHLASSVDKVVTISLGVTSMIPLENFSPRGLMLAADQALYLAKEEGRCCIRSKAIQDN